MWFLPVYLTFEEGMKDFFFESIKVPIELLQWGDVKEKKKAFFCPILTRSDVPPVKKYFVLRQMKTRVEDTSLPFHALSGSNGAL